MSRITYSHVDFDVHDELGATAIRQHSSFFIQKALFPTHPRELSKRRAEYSYYRLSQHPNPCPCCVPRPKDYARNKLVASIDVTSQ